MGEIGIALAIAGGLLFCGGVLWLVSCKSQEMNPIPSLGAVLLSVSLTAFGVSLWIMAESGVDEDYSNVPDRKSVSGAGGSMISMAWERTENCGVEITHVAFGVFRV